MRDEYPRPDFVRSEWVNLNGAWDFYLGGDKRSIEVPYVCQCRKSGIGERIREDAVVYERTFFVPDTWKGRSVLLNFGAVDYFCRVWVNGQCVGTHSGGQTPFSFDVTHCLNWGEECIRVEVEDWLKNEQIARGKQYWEDESSFIWYTPSTGIWQTVWLEPVSASRFSWIRFTPDIDEGTVKIDYRLEQGTVLPCEAMITICREEKPVFKGTVWCRELCSTITVDVFQKKALNGSFHFVGAYWSPENPNLYEVTMALKNGTEVTDRVESYFGMRKVRIEGGRIYLNNQPYYQKLLLDQGYWEESLITAPSDEDYKNDILMSKAMGFNGCRKHEKVEDPRFLYWADHLGFLVWEAMASFWVYTPEGACAFMREWMDVIRRDYNHPSIVVWGMLNESWGVPGIYENQEQQSFSKSLYYMARSLDSTRLVISNDGWEMTDTDICAVHSYQHGREDDQKQQELYKNCLKEIDELPKIVEKRLFAKGHSYQKQPVVLTEFGGIAVSEDESGWGYTAIGRWEFLKEYSRILDAVYDSDLICGYCYTQLTDVEQETNGLLTSTHQYKFDPEKIKEINDRRNR